MHTARIFKLAFFILITSGFLFLTSCESYQRVLRSNDLDYKHKKALEYYNKGDYYRAIPLLEELISVYRGTRSVEQIYYYYCYSHYAEENYLIAAYHFKQFHQMHPNSEYAEEALYMHAFSYYSMSPVFSLDQTYTKQAINGFRSFVNTYPNSERVSKVNNQLDQLRRKMELKAFRGAKLYYNTGRYRAAAVSFENFLNNFPDTRDEEQVYLYIVRSHYKFAQNSVESMKMERYQQVIEKYLNFVENFSNPAFLSEAEELYASSIDNIEKLKIKQQ